MSIPSRAASSRDANARAAIGGEAKGQLDIDTTGIPPDMEPLWVREMVMGQRDDNNVSDALNRQGYDVVPPSMLANASYKRLPGAPVAVETEQVVRRGGHILMMRPKTVAEDDRALQREEVQAQKNAAIRVSDVKGAVLGSEAFHEMEPAIETRIPRAPGRPRGFKE